MLAAVLMPRSSNLTRTVTTWFFLAALSSKKPRKNSAKTSWRTSPQARFEVALSPLWSTLVRLSTWAVWTDSSTFQNYRGSTSTTQALSYRLATRSPFKFLRSTSHGSASACRSRQLSKIHGKNLLLDTGSANLCTGGSPSLSHSDRLSKLERASRVWFTSPKCLPTTSTFQNKSLPRAKSYGSKSSILTCSVAA